MPEPFVTQKAALLSLLAALSCNSQPASTKGACGVVGAGGAGGSAGSLMPCSSPNDCGNWLQSCQGGFCQCDEVQCSGSAQGTGLGGKCLNGTCVCPAGMSLTQCVVSAEISYPLCSDLQTDPNNCGGCSYVCSGSVSQPACIGGCCDPSAPGSECTIKDTGGQQCDQTMCSTGASSSSSSATSSSSGGRDPLIDACNLFYMHLNGGGACASCANNAPSDCDRPGINTACPSTSSCTTTWCTGDQCMCALLAQCMEAAGANCSGALQKFYDCSNTECAK